MKFAKAERALAKVQEALVPTDLPIDLETVTDEERAKFRSIGLKMKSFLSLGMLSLSVLPLFSTFLSDASCRDLTLPALLNLIY